MSLADMPCTSVVPRRSDFSAIILALRGSAFSSACTHSTPFISDIDVLGQQPRIVAAPGADDHLLVLRGGREGGERGGARERPATIDHEGHDEVSLSFISLNYSLNTWPADACQPT